MFESGNLPGAIIRLSCSENFVIEELSDNITNLMEFPTGQKGHAIRLIEDAINLHIQNEFKEKIKGLLLNSGSDSISLKLVLPNKKILPIQLDFYIDENEQNKLTHILGYLTIIHSDKELQLKKYLNNYFEEDLSANFICNHDGDILFCNQTFAKILKYERKSLALESNFNCHFSNDQHRKIFWDTLEKKGQIKNHEMSALDANGDRVYLVLNIFAEKSKNGSWNEAVGQFNDISDRREANLHLKKSEERYRTLIETTKDWIWEVDRNFKITYSNTNSSILLNRSNKQVTELSLFDLIPENTREFYKQTFKKLANDKIPFLNLEHSFLTAHGVQVPVETSGIPLYNEKGHFKGYRCISRDISNQKENEEKISRLNERLEQKVKERTQQLELANRELEAFSYSVSHDLQAPLRRIKGFSEAIRDLLSKEVQDDTIELYLEKISSSANYMTQLIRGMIELAKVSKSNLTLTKFNFSDVAEEVAEMCSQEYPKISYTFNIDSQIMMYADKTLMKTVLQNLISNACKFSVNQNARSPEISIGKIQKGGRMVYYVKDNGAGFNMKYAHKLFTPFQRLHNEADFPGTGIGLPSVKRIIHRHFGKVWAESKIGEGAVFYFTLNTGNLKSK